MDLTGKVAIVTGGARDIGKQVTLKLVVRAQVSLLTTTDR